MIVLALDTTGRDCSAALVTPTGVLARSSQPIGRGHAEHIGPQVAQLFSEADLTPAAMTRIAVCTGPGSFTGLRVGIALAKGLALPRALPVIGISALDVWAASADPEGMRRVMAAADIRRSQIMWQIFERGMAISAPVSGAPEQARAHLDKATQLCGSGASLITDAATQNQRGYTDPAILAWLAMNKDPALCPPAPLYSRPPDAKLPGGITPP